MVGGTYRCVLGPARLGDGTNCYTAGWIVSTRACRSAYASVETSSARTAGARANVSITIGRICGMNDPFSVFRCSTSVLSLPTLFFVLRERTTEYGKRAVAHFARDGNTKPSDLFKSEGFVKRCRRRPTLPRSRERSTIGAVGLNDRVRNGNECGPYALVASEYVGRRIPRGPGADVW